MTKQELLPYVVYCLDDALAVHSRTEMPDLSLVRMAVWEVGFEPFVVAVWSYLPNTYIDADDAEDIARDYLEEIQWFSDPDASNPASFVI